MPYKILSNPKWYTASNGFMVGIVAIDSHEGDWKAYIGVVNDYGNSPETDAQSIAARGARIHEIEVACAHFPDLERGKFIVN